MGILIRYEKTAIVAGLSFLFLTGSVASADPASSSQTLDQLKASAVAAPADASVQDSYGMALAAATQYQQAEVVIESAITLSPTVEQYQLDLATTQDRAGDPTSAIATLTKVVRTFPANGIAELDMAEAYEDQGNQVFALDCFVWASEFLPASFQVHYEYGQALITAGKYPDAENEFQNCVQLLPSDANCLIGLATAQSQEGRTAEAAETLTSAVALGTMSPDSESQAHMQIAALDLQMSKVSAAVAELKRAVTLSPDDPRTHNALGAALLASGDSKSAMAEWRTALKSNDPAAQHEARQWIHSLGNN